MNRSLPLLLLLLLLSISVSSQENECQRIVNTVPSKVPIRVEIVNGDTGCALEDTEIRVTNSGKKAIFFLGLSVSSEKEFQYRNGVGFSTFHNGSGTLSDFSRPFSSLTAERAETVPFKPGETIVLKIPKTEAKASWKMMMDYGYPKDSRLKFYMTLLRFEDGTGYMTPQAVEMPDPPKA
jgi:hypothetical protein